MTTATTNDTIRILDAIKCAGPAGLTAREIGSALGIHPDTVGARLVRLKGRGEVFVRGANDKRGGGLVHVSKAAAERFGGTKALDPIAPKTKRPSKAKKKPGILPIAHEAHFAAAAASNQPVATITSPAVKLKNHFVIVLDHSGSMAQHRSGALELLNRQIREIKAASDQENTITIYGIGAKGDTHVDEKQFNVPAGLTPESSDYVAGHGTPLFRGVLAASRRASVSGDPATSFVVLVLTDGQDTEHDTNRERELRELIAEKTKTDRWTFAFLVPPGHYKRSLVAKLEIPEGNVQEWSDASRAAVETQVSTQAFLSSRRSGATRSASYFQPNAATVDVTKLRDVTADVKSYTADEEWSLKAGNDAIRGFVNARTRGQFAPGRQFFVLGKREKKIEHYKSVMLRDRSTGRIYADNGTTRVRDLLGFPTAGAISVEPGNHGNFDVLVQSMSTNRTIARNEKVYFWPGAV